MKLLVRAWGVVLLMMPTIGHADNNPFGSRYTICFVGHGMAYLGGAAAAVAAGDLLFKKLEAKTLDQQGRKLTQNLQEFLTLKEQIYSLSTEEERFRMQGDQRNFQVIREQLESLETRKNQMVIELSREIPKIETARAVDVSSFESRLKAERIEMLKTKEQFTKNVFSGGVAAAAVGGMFIMFDSEVAAVMTAIAGGAKVKDGSLARLEATLTAMGHCGSKVNSAVTAPPPTPSYPREKDEAFLPPHLKEWEYPTLQEWLEHQGR